MKNRIVGFTIGEIFLSVLLIGIISVLILPFVNGSFKYSSWQKSMDYKMGALKYAKILGALEKGWSSNLNDATTSAVTSVSFLNNKTNTVLSMLNLTGDSPDWTAEQLKNMKNPVFTKTAVLADGTWIGEVASNNCTGTYSDKKNALVDNICSALYVDTNGEKHKSIIGEDVLMMLFLKNGKVLAMSYKTGKLEVNTKIGKLYKAKKYVVQCPNSDNKITYTKDERTGLYKPDGECPSCTISNLDELKTSLASKSSGCSTYSLISNIIFPDSNTEPLIIANGVSLDGNGKTISGFITQTPPDNKKPVGLFATIGCDSKISNLTLADMDVASTGDNVGALAGKACGDIEDITVKDSSVIGNNNVGGIVGYQDANLIANLRNIIIPQAYAQNIANNLSVDNILIVGKSNVREFIGNKDIKGNKNKVDLKQGAGISCNAKKPSKFRGHHHSQPVFNDPIKALQQGKCTLGANEYITQNGHHVACENSGKLCYRVDEKGVKRSCKYLAPNKGDKINREETWNANSNKYHEDALYPPDAYLEGRCKWPDDKGYIIHSILLDHNWTNAECLAVRLSDNKLVFGANCLGTNLITKPYSCQAWCEAHLIPKKDCPKYCFIPKPGK